ncbi:MAG: hypothetical protein N2652_07045 [Kiritimatiellae bacterium]|nr:hypothetical protein [Kiritimatiellia bacterium]
MADDVLMELRTPNRAMVMELETFAIPLRRVLFEAAREALSEQGITFDEAAMIRYGVHAAPRRIAAALAAAYGLKPAAESALAERIERAATRFLESPAAVPLIGLDRVLNLAIEHNARLGFVSWQPEAAAAALIERLGFSRWTPVVSCSPSPAGEFPGADSWLRLLKSMARRPQDSVALVNSHVACRSALTAGLRIVVVPDDFTLHQDFSGADVLTHHLADLDAQMLFGRL